MKSKNAIKKYAHGLAEGHFYSDDNVPWQPFEDQDEEWLHEHVEYLAHAVERAMLWARGDDEIPR